MPGEIVPINIEILYFLMIDIDHRLLDVTRVHQEAPGLFVVVPEFDRLPDHRLGDWEFSELISVLESRLRAFPVETNRGGDVLLVSPGDPAPPIPKPGRRNGILCGCGYLDACSLDLDDCPVCETD